MKGKLSQTEWNLYSFKCFLLRTVKVLSCHAHKYSTVEPAVLVPAVVDFVSHTNNNYEKSNLQCSQLGNAFNIKIILIRILYSLF